MIDHKTESDVKKILNSLLQPGLTLEAAEVGIRAAWGIHEYIQDQVGEIYSEEFLDSLTPRLDEVTRAHIKADLEAGAKEEMKT